MPRGETLTLEQTWALSKLWYANRMRPEFHGRTPQEAQAIFQQLDLRSPFWSS